MAKYDWNELKRDFMLGDYKSLSDFAVRKDIINNGYFRKTTKGWLEEKRQRQARKDTKILEKVTEQEIKYEIDRNAAHLAAGDTIMTKLNVVLQQLKTKDKNAMYLLQTAATTLEKVQKSQRLGEGIRDDSTNDGLIASLQQAAENINLADMDIAEDFDDDGESEVLS